MAETIVDKSAGVPSQGASDLPVEDDRASTGDQVGFAQSSTAGNDEGERAQTTASTGAVRGGGDEENSSELGSSDDDSDEDSGDDSGYRARGPPTRPVGNSGHQTQFQVKEKPPKPKENKDQPKQT